jgi:hypothetical protein
MEKIKLNQTQVEDLLSGAEVTVKLGHYPEGYEVLAVGEAHSIVYADNGVVVVDYKGTLRRFDGVAEDVVSAMAKVIDKDRKAEQLPIELTRLKARVIDWEGAVAKVSIYGHYSIEPTGDEGKVEVEVEVVTDEAVEPTETPTAPAETPEPSDEPEPTTDTPEPTSGVKHILTQEDLDQDPSLAEEGLKVGDEIEIHDFTAEEDDAVE